MKKKKKRITTDEVLQIIKDMENTYSRDGKYMYCIDTLEELTLRIKNYN